MQNRIVEIASDGAYLSASRGFLKVQINNETVGQVAIDDMCALIVRGFGASISINLCSRLSEANIPVVICGSNQSPASVIWPVSGHFAQGLQMQAQAVSNKPLQKRLWAQLVKAKILAQAEVLEAHGLNHSDIRAMVKRVRSGDSENVEAQAARRYWPRLMGKEFKRGPREGGINSSLNYGYTVMRAAVARSVLAAGLHPSLSIQHQSRGDAFRLADDLMEPFRPWVDHIVRKDFVNWGEEGEFTLEQDQKARLADVLTLDMQGPQGASPLQVCIDRLAQSLTQVFLKQRSKLELPGPPLPLLLRVK